jgi:hypothetical protein
MHYLDSRDVDILWTDHVYIFFLLTSPWFGQIICIFSFHLCWIRAQRPIRSQTIWNWSLSTFEEVSRPLDEIWPHANKGWHQFHEEDKIVVGDMDMFLFLLIEWMLYWARANHSYSSSKSPQKWNQCTSVLGICFKLILIPSMTRSCRDS